MDESLEYAGQAVLVLPQQFDRDFTCSPEDAVDPGRTECIYQIWGQSERDLLRYVKRSALGRVKRCMSDAYDRMSNDQPTFSNKQLKSTCNVSPVVESNRMFSPCRSPNLFKGLLRAHSGYVKFRWHSP